MVSCKQKHPRGSVVNIDTVTGILALVMAHTWPDYEYILPVQED